MLVLQNSNETVNLLTNHSSEVTFFFKKNVDYIPLYNALEVRPLLRHIAALNNKNQNCVPSLYDIFMTFLSSSSRSHVLLKLKLKISVVCDSNLNIAKFVSLKCLVTLITKCFNNSKFCFPTLCDESTTNAILGLSSQTKSKMNTQKFIICWPFQFSYVENVFLVFFNIS